MKKNNKQIQKYLLNHLIKIFVFHAIVIIVVTFWGIDHQELSDQQNTKPLMMEKSSRTTASIESNVKDQGIAKDDRIANSKTLASVQDHEPSPSFNKRHEKIKKILENNYLHFLDQNMNYEIMKIESFKPQKDFSHLTGKSKSNHDLNHLYKVQLKIIKNDGLTNSFYLVLNAENGQIIRTWGQNKIENAPKLQLTHPELEE